MNAQMMLLTKSVKIKRLLLTEAKMKMIRMNGRALELLTSRKTLKQSVKLAVIFKVNGERHGMTKATRSGPRRRVKTLTQRINGEKSG